MSKINGDRKSDVKKATALKDDELDGISGGPHFRTWDGTFYDYHGVGELDASVKQTHSVKRQS